MTDATCYESHIFLETPLGKPRMALQAYMPALQGVHKASAQQIQECIYLNSFKDKNA